MSDANDLVERRARLVAAADLERLKIGLAWRDVRQAFAPVRAVGRRSPMRSFVVRAIGFALPIVGIRRMGRTLRFAGAAIAIWRVVRAWRSPG